MWSPIPDRSSRQKPILAPTAGATPPTPISAPSAASAAAAAESLCRIIEHAPNLDEVPSDLIEHHINAIQAIVRERTRLDTVSTANELSWQLRGIADEFLMHANRDRPEHLEAILAPGIVPAD